MAKRHARSSHKSLHFLFMQPAFDKLIAQTTVSGRQ
jgi:hypothetical protein